MYTERDLNTQLKQFANSIQLPKHMEQNMKGIIDHRKQRKSNSFKQAGRIILGTVGSFLVLGSVAFASGFVNPQLASVLQKLPLIGGVADALYASENTYVQRAIEQGYNIPINQSLTRNGLTITVTNAYFGPEQLWIGMTEAFSKNRRSHPRIHLDNVKFLVNGKKWYPMGVEFRPLADGSYAGDVNLQSLPANFPKHIVAMITIRKIGSTVGNWHFSIPLSQQSTDHATRTYQVNVTKKSTDFVWTIHRVAITPASVRVYGQVTVPGQYYPNFEVESVGSKSRWSGSEPLIFKPISHTDATSTWSFSVAYGKPANLGTFVTLEPVYIPDFYFTNLQIPLHTRSAANLINPEIFFAGTTEQMNFTSITVKPSTIQVNYNTIGNTYKEGNYYHLALRYSQDGFSKLRMEYPSGFRIVNQVKHEAQLTFKRIPNWTPNILIYYPSGLPEILPKSYGITLPSYKAPNLSIRLRLN